MDLHNAVYSLLTKVADEFYNPIPLIFAYQNAERRIKPYGTIRVDTTVIAQHELYLPVTHEGFQTFGGWRRAIVELQLYGKDSGPAARRFALSLQSNSSLEHAQRINIAVSTRLFLSEVPELLNLEQYEERGIYQFEILYSDELDDRVGIIDHVEITWSKTDIPDGGIIEDYPQRDEYCKIEVEVSPPQPHGQE